MPERKLMSQAQALLELLICGGSRLDYKRVNARALRQNSAELVKKLWEMLMRLMRNATIVVLLALGGAALLGSAPANAVGTRHPFCIQGNEFPALSNCTFDSYAQCMAAASGRILTCVANPFFIGRTDDPYAYPNRNRPFPRDYYAPPPNAYWGR